MSNPWLWWVDLPIKAYDEQLVEEKKSKRWGASWVLQSQERWCGWFTLYIQKTDWSPERGKNVREIHHILRKPSFTKRSAGLSPEYVQWRKWNDICNLLCPSICFPLKDSKYFWPVETEAYLASPSCFWRVRQLFGRRKRKSSKIKDLALPFL